MSESRRQKKVASLIKEALSRPLSEVLQEIGGLVTITRVEMSPDLRTAHVFISLFDLKDRDRIMDLLALKQGYLRKSVASKTKLKYNPTLFFELDPSSSYEENIDRIIKRLKNNEDQSH